MKKVLVSWSGGKDSAWMLHLLRKQPEIQVAGLLTTVNAAHDRVSIHGTRRALLDAQAASLNLPLWPVMLPNPCSNQDYEEAMRKVISRAKSEGIESIAFGDLFLEDVRVYRTSRLSGTGIAPLFPLWQKPTHTLGRQMISEGLRAKVVTVDPRLLSPSFAGREYDLDLLAELPATVDPCGENGEFHTYVYSGPMFSSPIPLTLGETVEKEGFIYKDLFPCDDIQKM